MQVLIENNRIKAVSAQNIRSRNAQVIDGKGKTLMPGLIDAHYHALAADLNIRRIDALSPYHVAQYARQFLENTLRRGFTTVRDAGGADFGLAQAIAEGLIQGPRLFYSGKALSQTGGHGDSRLP
ncbi:MAG: amidohydrolase family protein, partial [Candidatus Competibacteraceae bacterium]|nr:amidohydrolase family protein [Candidatus Competibacteraceae bacterium]